MEKDLFIYYLCFQLDNTPYENWRRQSSLEEGGLGVPFAGPWACWEGSSFEVLQVAGGLHPRDGCVSLQDCVGEQGAAPGVMNRVLQEGWVKITEYITEELQTSKGTGRQGRGGINSSLFSSI